MFPLDKECSLISQFHQKSLGAYGSLVRVVRLKWSTSALVKDRVCQGIRVPTGSVWYGCVSLNPYRVSEKAGGRRRLGIICNRRVILPAGFLLCGCAQVHNPHCSLLLICMIIKVIKGLMRYFTFYLFHFVLFSFSFCSMRSISSKRKSMIFIHCTERNPYFTQVFLCSTATSCS